MGGGFRECEMLGVARRGVVALLSIMLCLAAISTTAMAEPGGEESLGVDEIADGGGNGASAEASMGETPVAMPQAPATLSTQWAAHTQAEAVAWANSQQGKALDFDGAYGAQCVDFTCYYYQYLGQATPWGNANQYVNGGAFVPAGWSYQSSPQPGDIAVWTTGPYGHVAIVTEIRGSQMVCMEQNYAGRAYCTPNLHAIDAQTYIRPDWPQTVSNREPVGMVSSCERAGNHLLRVRGWAYDPDAPNDAIAFHVYVGGRAGEGGRGYAYDAVGNQLLANSQFRGQGMSEFDFTLYVDETCVQPIYIYAIDHEGGNNPELNGSGARVSLYLLSDHQAISVGSGPFVIRVAIGNLVLDVPGASKENAENVHVWERNESDAQQFVISGDSGGYVIKARCSGLQLDTWGGGAATIDEVAVANVVQHVDNGGKNQRWVFEDTGDGYVFIRNQLGYYLDIVGATNANGTNVQAYLFNGSDAQKWKLEKPSLAYATLSGVGSQTYDGRAKTPGLKVTMNGVVLKAGTDYTLEYRNNVNVGTATLIVKGKGIYAGTKSTTFKITPGSTPAPTPAPSPGKTFPDVTDGAWYADVVGRAAKLGLINGYRNGKFGPNDKVTRGQVAVILWNMADNPAPRGSAKSFSDVKAGRYYYDAVRWASSTGVVNGYKNGRYGPEDLVTREQLAAMLTSYARQIAGRETTGSASAYRSMKDAAKVSGWARTSVGWCFRNGIVSGTKDGRIAPQDNATRAETAKMVVFLRDMLA